MQEHPPYKITPDQGWSQMRLLLDKVMQEERRPRRFMVFWWSTAVAIVAILISVFLLTGKDKPVDLRPTATTSMEMTSNDHKAPGDETNTNSSASTSAHENNPSAYTSRENQKLREGGNQETISSSAKKIATPNNSLISKSKNKFEKQTHLVALDQHAGHGENDDQVALIENSTDVIETSNLITSHQTQAAGDRAPIANEINAKDRNTFALGFLPLVDAVISEYVGGEIGFIKPGISSSGHKRHAITPTISAGAIAGSQNGLGMNVGIGADYAISSRLSLTAGVSYRSYHPYVLNTGNSDRYSPYADLNPILTSDPTYIVGEKVNSSTDYNAIFPFIHSINQWQAGTGLKYTITRRFFVEGGILLGFGTTAKSEFPILINGSFTAPADANISRSFDSYDIIRSNMTSVYGGLGYRMSRHFNVYAQWTHGFDHYLLNDQLSIIDLTTKRSDYIRGLQLGLRYQL